MSKHHDFTQSICGDLMARRIWDFDDDDWEVMAKFSLFREQMRRYIPMIMMAILFTAITIGVLGS